MAIALSATFLDLTEFRDMFDVLEGSYSSIKTAKNAIVTRYDTTGVEDLIPTTEAAASTLMTALDTACVSFKSALTSRLLHPEQLDDLARYYATTSMTEAEKLQAFFVAFWEAQNTGGVTVGDCAVTVGSVTADTEETNAGEVELTKKLSGVKAPTPNAPINQYYFDRDSELTKTDKIMIEVVTDVQSGAGISRGYETFRISGYQSTAPGPFSTRYDVDGDGQVLTGQYTIQANNVLTNMGFDAFTTTDTPDDWTINTGSPSTDIFEESTNVVGSGAALRLTGTVDISQNIPATAVRGRSQMYLAFLLRKDGATSGTYTISVTGTGFTTVTSGALNAADLTTTFVPLLLRIPVPANVPDDFQVNIVTSSVSGGNGILIDNGGLAEIPFWNGIGVAISEGEDSFTVGDHWEATLTNGYQGDIQEMIVKTYRAQLLSTTSGETYP